MIKLTQTREWPETEKLLVSGYFLTRIEGRGKNSIFSFITPLVGVNYIFAECRNDPSLYNPVKCVKHMFSLYPEYSDWLSQNLMLVIRENFPEFKEEIEKLLLLA